MSYSFERARSLYHIDFCLSSDFRKFFQIFLKFFSNFVFHLRGLSLNFFSDELLFQASFHRISHLTFICQAIFRSFFRFFWGSFEPHFHPKGLNLNFLSDKPFLRASFHKISHLTFICQLIFRSFFRNFQEFLSEVFKASNAGQMAANSFIYWAFWGCVPCSEDVFPATAQLRYHL